MGRWMSSRLRISRADDAVTKDWSKKPASLNGHHLGGVHLSRYFLDLSTMLNTADSAR